jgi:hypothetical protein
MILECGGGTIFFTFYRAIIHNLKHATMVDRLPSMVGFFPMVHRPWSVFLVARNGIGPSTKGL